MNESYKKYTEHVKRLKEIKQIPRLRFLQEKKKAISQKEAK